MDINDKNIEDINEKKIKSEEAEYLQREFFNKDDRKISFLIGRYYGYLAAKEKTVLRTTSLYTKLPMYTQRLNREQLLKILDKCNSVVKRLISKNKETKQTGTFRRNQISELISKDNWESTYDELSLALMMGFSYFVKIDKKSKKGEKNVITE